jgi:integrase
VVNGEEEASPPSYPSGRTPLGYVVFAQVRHPPKLSGPPCRAVSHRNVVASTGVGTSISRNTFRTRVWLPAVKASGIDFGVRVHDLRHPHASWLLAGGADLKGVMDRMGHAQIQTTQKYLHTLPDTDQKNLDALTRMTGRSVRNRMS